jgi:hypothetical protein
MQRYLILRRGAWHTRDEAFDALTRGGSGAERRPEVVALVHSYVLEETQGTAGAVCIYEAPSPEAIRRHSAAAGLPVDEIVRVADTLSGELRSAEAALRREEDRG